MIDVDLMLDLLFCSAGSEIFVGDADQLPCGLRATVQDFLESERFPTAD